MYKIVNGYPCTSGCDVDLARRNVDPRNPRNDPVKQAELDAKDPAKAVAEEIRAAASVNAAAADRDRPSYGPAVSYGGGISEPPAAPAIDRPARRLLDISL
ncbi:hypothetical protein [Chthonobacter albigriseus]|uniref:hypothetical protein n=1 Tax=Chthonobacter albigriseus TaxID=1683161 RepID=UPI0015EF6B5E|nr:hypothetical protein [Chthonobacter albigriseus]